MNHRGRASLDSRSGDVEITRNDTATSRSSNTPTGYPIEYPIPKLSSSNSPASVIKWGKKAASIELFSYSRLRLNSFREMSSVHLIEAMVDITRLVRNTAILNEFYWYYMDWTIERLIISHLSATEHMTSLSMAKFQSNCWKSSQ